MPNPFEGVLLISGDDGGVFSTDLESVVFFAFVRGDVDLRGPLEDPPNSLARIIPGLS